MIELDMGDIFNRAVEENRDLMIVFGHCGFNEMRVYWQKFKPNFSCFDGINDPFRELDGQWSEFNPNKWAVFISPTVNHGMSDDEIQNVLNSILIEAYQRKFRTIITNGIRNTHREDELQPWRVSDARRVKLIQRVIKDHIEHFDSIKLISRNSCFISSRARLHAEDC